MKLNLAKEIVGRRGDHNGLYIQFEVAEVLAAEVARLELEISQLRIDRGGVAPAGNWSKNIPTEPGIYEFKCAENLYVPDCVTVYRRRANGVEALWVNDSELGSKLLEHFHNGLINLEWRTTGNRSFSP